MVAGRRDGGGIMFKDEGVDFGGAVDLGGGGGSGDSWGAGDG